MKLLPQPRSVPGASGTRPVSALEPPGRFLLRYLAQKGLEPYLQLAAPWGNA